MKKHRITLLITIVTLLFSFNLISHHSESVKVFADDSTQPFGQTETGVKDTLKKIDGNHSSQAFGKMTVDEYKSKEHNYYSIIDVDGAQQFRNQGLNIVHIIAGLMFGFALISVVFAGFKITMSEGNEKTVREAKLQIILAGIGIGIALLTEVIGQLFTSVLSTSS